MSESGHSSLPSYPTLPPSELDQYQLISLDEATTQPPPPHPSSLSEGWHHPTSSTGPQSPSLMSFTPSTNFTTGVGGSKDIPPLSMGASALHMYRPSDPQTFGSTQPSSSVGSPGLSSLSSSSTSHLRLQYLEQLCMSMRREKEQSEVEFGRQRKMFMNHMTEVDNELSLAKQTNMKLSDEVRELSTQLLYKDEELKSVAAASKMTQAQYREAFDADRVKYEEEIASLRQLISESKSGHGQSSSVSGEKEKWKQEKSLLLSEIHELKSRSLSPMPALTVNSSATSNENSRTASPDESLESSMLREIDMLKTKLSEAEERIRYYEGQRQMSSSLSPERDAAMAPLISLESPAQASNPGFSLPASPSPTPTDPNKQLQNLLELERAATHDLEMHTKQLKSQKAFLQNEVAEVTKQLQQANKELEAERKRHNDLKKTWELANTHFITAQDQLKSEIEQLHQKLQEVGGADGGKLLGAQLLGLEGGFKMDAAGVKKKSLSSEAINVRSGSKTVVDSQARAVSWYNLHQSSSMNVGKVWELSNRVSSLESELASARAEVVRLEGLRLGLETQCSRYESQLHRVQAQMVEEMDGKERTIDKLRAEMEKYKAGIMRERQLRLEVRNKLDQTREEIKTRIENFTGEEGEVSRQLRMLDDRFREIKVDTQKEIARLVQERASLYHQIESAREEYECLKVVQATGINDYQDKLKHAFMNQKEAELNLRTTMEQLSTLQLEKQNVEESLAGQLAANKEELITLRTNYDRLKRELAVATDKLGALEDVQLVLEEERRSKDEIMAGRVSIERKSKEFIENQQRKMEELNQAKESSEKQVKELQHQLGLLKSQLSHSEETQKDFVELSQSLQMRLAEIEDQQLNQSQDFTSAQT